MRRLNWKQFTISCDATNNTVPTTAGSIALSGYIVGIKIKTPATVDNTATVAVTIKDSDTDTIYTKSGIAVNTTNQEYADANNVLRKIPVAGTITINPVFSANQTVARNVVVTLLIDSLI